MVTAAEEENLMLNRDGGNLMLETAVRITVGAFWKLRGEISGQWLVTSKSGSE